MIDNNDIESMSKDSGDANKKFVIKVVFATILLVLLASFNLYIHMRSGYRIDYRSFIMPLLLYVLLVFLSEKKRKDEINSAYKNVVTENIVGEDFVYEEKGTLRPINELFSSGLLISPNSLEKISCEDIIVSKDRKFTYNELVLEGRTERVAIYSERNRVQVITYGLNKTYDGQLLITNSVINKWPLNEHWEKAANKRISSELPEKYRLCTNTDSFEDIIVGGNFINVINSFVEKYMKYDEFIIAINLDRLFIIKTNGEDLFSYDKNASKIEIDAVEQSTEKNTKDFSRLKDEFKLIDELNI